MQLDFFHIGGASIVLRINGQVKIGVDPILNPKGTPYNFTIFRSTRIQDPVYDNDTFSDVNLWLLTHNHADHIDKPGREMISPGSSIIIQKDLEKIMSSTKYSNIKILEWLGSYQYEFEKVSIKVTAIPAFHASNGLMRLLVGKVNGYLLTISADSFEKNIYLTSDTIYHPKVLKVVHSCLKSKKLDVLVANLGNVRDGHFGSPLTMSVGMLSKFQEILKPEITIPIHYDDFSHYKSLLDSINAAGFTLYKKGEWHQLF